jgi:head-tail adaptor
MNPGKMRTLICFERLKTVRSDVEQTADFWEQYTQAFCEVTTPADSEQVTSGKLSSESLLSLSTHWTPISGGIDSTMRARLPDGPLAGVRSATNVNLANREMLITLAIKQ